MNSQISYSLKYFVSAIMGALIFLVSPDGFCKTLEVGPGRPYSTIQSAVNAARAGDTVLVHEGTFNEEIFSVSSGTQSNPITIRSNTQFGAVVSGGSTRPHAFEISHDYIIIQGFLIKNVRIDGTDEAAILFDGSDYNTVEWCKFTGNSISTGEGAIIIVKNSSHISIRGNRFEQNSWSNINDTSVIHIFWGGSHTIEGNYFGDADTDRYYDLYHANGGDNSTIRYNYFCAVSQPQFWSAQIRDVEHIQYYHNYIGSDTLFRDDTGVSVQNENHNIHHNTWNGGHSSNPGVGFTNIENSLFTKNLVMNMGTNNPYLENLWGVSTGNTASNNVRVNSGPSGDWTGGNIETGTQELTADAVKLDPSTKCNILNDRGSDLDVHEWPFTKCNGDPLFSGYIYGDPPPATPKHLRMKNN